MYIYLTNARAHTLVHEYLLSRSKYASRTQFKDEYVVNYVDVTVLVDTFKCLCAYSNFKVCM